MPDRFSLGLTGRTSFFMSFVMVCTGTFLPCLKIVMLMWNKLAKWMGALLLRPLDTEVFNDDLISA